MNFVVWEKEYGMSVEHFIFNTLEPTHFGEQLSVLFENWKFNWKNKAWVFVKER